MIEKDIRKVIATEVSSIYPFDALEAEHQADVLGWIASSEPLFRIQKPDVPPKHLVSYFVLVDPDQKSVLLVDHIKAQLWLPAGGHVDLGEHPRATVVRELAEELHKEAVFLWNNDHPQFVTVTQTVGLTPGHTDVSLWYVLRSSAQDFFEFDRREFNDVQWFTFDEVLSMDGAIFDPHMQRFVQKLKVRLRE